MLIRVSGAASGIKEYLEKGHKDGRENTRDELDQRVILDGDLDLTDEIINRMNNSGERYLHITLSFKEDEISPEAMRAIVADFKFFAMTAYNSDEYNFYAEAHCPKIKSYTHRETGEFIERKPHIHVVIPESNLLTGQKMNPLGRVEQQTKFLDAFQEHVNHKYGLASPKDHRRTEITSASEMISRYKGDIFDGNNRDLKQRLLSEVLEKKIMRYEDFKAMLAEHGATRARNAGKDTEYQNVKLEGQARGVNLKEFVFSREFVELPEAAKRARLAEDARHHYDTAKDPRPTPGEISDRLKEWHNVRAKEVKYLNSGNKKFYAQYKDSTTEQRRDLLKDREQRFYEKHRKEVSHDRSNRKPDINAVGREAPPIARTRLRSLSELDVVRDTKGSEVLLPRDVPRELADRRADADRGVRRPDDRAGRGSDSVTGQLLKDVSERRNQRTGASDEMTEIRSKLDARHLLAHVSRTHGVMPEKYEITKAKDGTDRIKCGTRNLSTSDFLTKEMNLSWKEAAPILRDSYAEQLGREPRRERHAPKRVLWTEYRNDWKPKQQAAKTHEWQVQRDSEKTRRADIRDAFYGQRSSLQGNRKLTKAAKKSALSVARMEKVVKEGKLREAIKIERQALKEKYQKPAAEQYRDYLAEKVDHGSEDALKELRRQRTERATEDETPNRYRPHQVDARPDVAPIMSHMTYTVARNGDVTYNDEDGRGTLKDVGHEVRLLKVDDKTIETGLRFAMQKFGKTIDITGDSEFKRRAVEVAVARGIDVEFSDREAKQYYAALKHQQEVDKQHQALGKEFFKDQKEAQTTKPVQQKDRDRERVRNSPGHDITTPEKNERER
jgi:hypothetical protein